jgi:anti-sigma regulatory factor (Ser/Thr protein kinase)
MPLKPETLGTPGEPHREADSFASVTVPGRVASIRPAAAFIVDTARNMQVPAALDPLFEVAIVEALNNAVKHGTTAARPDAMVVCELELIGRCLTVRILDRGPGFVVPRTPRPDWDTDDISTVPENGYGVSIIQRVFSTVRTIARPGEFGIEMALTF